MARLTVSVDEDVKEMLLELAEGERKQGEYLTDLIRNAYDNRQMGISHLDMEMMRLTIEGLASRIRQQEGRLLALERQMARKDTIPQND